MLKLYNWQTSPDVLFGPTERTNVTIMLESSEAMFLKKERFRQNSNIKKYNLQQIVRLKQTVKSNLSVQKN